MTNIMIILILVPIIAAILVIINYILAPHRPIFTKKTTFECGIISLNNQTRNPFNVVFYIISVLFLAFDLEIILCYPFITVLSLTGLYGFWIITVFFAILTLGFVVEFVSGALKFNAS